MKEANLIEAVRDNLITSEEFLFIFDCRIREAFRKGLDMAIEFTREHNEPNAN